MVSLQIPVGHGQRLSRGPTWIWYDLYDLKKIKPTDFRIEQEGNFYKTPYLRFRVGGVRKATLENISSPFDIDKVFSADFLLAQPGQSIDAQLQASIAVTPLDGDFNALINNVRGLIQYCSQSR